jgi:GGDEF domain-containing protein
VPAPAQPTRKARFTSTGTARRAAFLTLAQRFQIDPGSASDLYGVLLQSRPDQLTGFERAADREATVQEAALHAKKTGTAAVYAEIDVRNLGGLNRALGRQKADSVFAQVAAVVEGQMGDVSSIGDAWPFRHGGDEFSFVVVARRPGIDAGQLELAVSTALVRAAAAVKDQTSEYSGVSHTKPGGPPGTGIAWGTSVIGPGADPSKVFATADMKVERKKASASGAT